MKLEGPALFLTSALATAVFASLVIVVSRGRGILFKNYRGVEVVRPLGLVLPLAASVGVLVSLLVKRSATSPTVTAFLVVLWAFAFLGNLDDRFGSRESGGFRGHFGALSRGRVTTGVIKALGMPVTGVVAAFLMGLPPPRALLAGILIALAANFVNLLDVRPGRALKVFFMVALLMWLASAGAPGWELWPAVIPPALVLLVLDIREVGMLGDTGSNPLGALLGLTFVVNFAWQFQLAAAAVVAALTLLSEVYSFSNLIEANVALKWLDMLGRRPDGSQGGKREN